MERMTALQIFSERIAEFVDKWRSVMAPGRSRNYYHWLQVEALKEIQEHGSVWKYASDVTESYVHILKDAYLNFSSRGGAKHNPHWVKQVMHRVLIKMLLKALHNEPWLKILTPYERKRLSASLATATRMGDLTAV